MLGISVYPYKENIADTKKYIEDAFNLGYKRIFLNLLIHDENEINDFLENNRNIINFAKNLNFEIIVDVNPNIFKILKINPNDLVFFANLGVDGIRLDGVFNGDVESNLTYNPYNLKIELNASQNTKYIENILTKMPNIKNLISCHNFYPLRNSGLSEEFFITTSKISKRHNLRLAAFVTSQNKNTHGPHKVDDKLPTLEIHRDLDISIQVKHLIATRLIDDIIISNSFASLDELKRVKDVYKPYVVFKLKKLEGITENELTILKNCHKNRGDLAQNMIRSSLGRINYRELSIPNRNTHSNDLIKKGTVYIYNDNYGQYKGEIGIALDDISFDKDKINILGCIDEKELFLLNYIKEYTRFEFEF